MEFQQQNKTLIPDLLPGNGRGRLCPTSLTSFLMSYSTKITPTLIASSYRWDGLNFENRSFASKLSPPRCLPRNYAHSWYFLSASEACPALEIHQYTCMGKVARYKEKYKSRFCTRRLFLVTVTEIQRRYLQIGDLAISSYIQS